MATLTRDRCRRCSAPTPTRAPDLVERHRQRQHAEQQHRRRAEEPGRIPRQRNRTGRRRQRGGRRQPAGADRDLAHMLVPTSELLAKYHEGIGCGIGGLVPFSKSPPFDVPGIIISASFTLGVERYRYPAGPAQGGGQAPRSVLQGVRTARCASGIPGAVRWSPTSAPTRDQYGNQGILLNSDAPQADAVRADRAVRRATAHRSGCRDDGITRNARQVRHLRRGDGAADRCSLFAVFARGPHRIDQRLLGGVQGCVAAESR